MFEHFTLKNLNEAQATENRLRQMPAGERIAIKYNCLTCHKKEKGLVGPSFVKIAKRYTDNMAQMKKSIQNGSAKRWQGYRGALMPSFKNKISDKDLDTLVMWIEQIKREKNQ